MAVFRIFACLLILVLLCPAPIQAAAGHPDVWLRNQIGERISPAVNQFDSYSPRRTCGGCHPYKTITQGYHFRQGFDMPGKQSGLYGRGLDLAALPEPVAPKQFRASLAEGLAVYDWISAGARAGFPSAGWVMPGSGPLEFGRNRKGEADFSRTLIEGEAQGRATADGDYSSRLTPDRLSHFRESGVIEADCLICHYPGYKMDRRNAQINSRNYRWAATAGAGLGSVKGAIFTYSDPQARPESQGFLDGKWNFQKRPLVEYNWGSLELFTPEGRLKGKILSRNVGPENCLHCHGILDAAATGTSHAKKNDAHAKAGFRCTD
jgi:hypothetical protein